VTDEETKALYKSYINQYIQRFNMAHPQDRHKELNHVLFYAHSWWRLDTGTVWRLVAEPEVPPAAGWLRKIGRAIFRRRRV